MATIRDGAETCLNLFDECYSIFSARSDPTIFIAVQDQCQRFKIWSSNIGVFAEVQASLDFRVREFDDIRETFLSHLKVIESRLGELNKLLGAQPSGDSSGRDDERDAASRGSESLDSESDASAEFRSWTAPDLIQSTSDNIDWLHRLSNLIRKASFFNQLKRANSHPLQDEFGNDMTEPLSRWFQVLVKRESPDLQDDLLQRLVASMVLRRRQIDYRQSRQKRWDLRHETYTRQRTPVRPLRGVPEVSPEHAEAEILIQQTTVPDHNENPRSGVDAPQSAITLTTLDRKLYHELAAPSRISRGTSATLKANTRALVPPPPKSAAASREFVCEYCCLVLDGQLARDRGRWIDHVKRDTHSYVCVVDHCDGPLELFPTHHEWLTHIQTRHSIQWHCVHRSHATAVIFDSAEKFKDHMRKAHAGKFKEDQLSLIAESSSHPQNPTFQACPFCTYDGLDLEEHVGGHLRNLAILSLPWPKDESEGSGPPSTSTTDEDNSRHGLRSTVRDFRSDTSHAPLELDGYPESHIVPDITDAEPDRAASYSWLPIITDQHKAITRADQLRDPVLLRINFNQAKSSAASHVEPPNDAKIEGGVEGISPADQIPDPSISKLRETTPTYATSRLRPIFRAESLQSYIIIVPDVASSKPETWRSPRGEPWVQTLFDTTARHAQFFHYVHGEDASTAFRWDEIRSSAYELTIQLRDLRKQSAYTHISFQMICFGLGGLLVKEAWSRFQDEFRLLTGVTFLVTPHFTQDDELVWKTVSLIPKVKHKNAKKWKFRQGELAGMARACKEFESFGRPVLCVYETIETIVQSSLPGSLGDKRTMIIGKEGCASRSWNALLIATDTDFARATDLDVEGSAFTGLQGFVHRCIFDQRWAQSVN